MKLLNHTILYFAGALILILSIWATIFYMNMLDEVYDSLDDGLDNYKLLIIQKTQTDSTILYKTGFDEGNYAIKEISHDAAIVKKDVYKDTLMYMQNEKDYEPVRLLTTVFKGPGNKYYQLKVITSMVEEDDLIEDLLYSLLWLYLSLLVSILLLNNIILRYIWRPFYKLLKQLKTFRLGFKENIELPSTRIKEFKDLNQTVNELLQNNIATYHSQKQLIENASHELQTPLAISLNKLELLSEKESLDAESAETIASVMSTLERMTRLNKSLLLISKIENRQFNQLDNINLNLVVQQIITEFAEYAEFRKVRINCNQSAQLSVNMDQALAEILITNLVKNAIIHNYPGGKVEIAITETGFIIANTGKNAALDENKIQGRFYKESSDSTSTGLGLAIVYAITRLYNFKLSYAFNGMHKMQLDII